MDREKINSFIRLLLYCVSDIDKFTLKCYNSILKLRKKGVLMQTILGIGFVFLCAVVIIGVAYLFVRFYLTPSLNKHIDETAKNVADLTKIITKEIKR